MLFRSVCEQVVVARAVGAVNLAAGAGRLQQGAVERFDVLVAHLLRCDDADALRDFAQGHGQPKRGVRAGNGVAVVGTRGAVGGNGDGRQFGAFLLFTSNGQTPFTSLGFGLGTNRFEREIQKAILNIRIKGLGSEHRTAIFPKLIFTLKRGLNLEPGTLNYDIKELALECATKRMYPDVLSYDKIIDLTGSFKVPMGCRSFLQGWKDENGQEVNSGRMNLGVVTVNLPRIALESLHLHLQEHYKLMELIRRLLTVH